MFNRLFLAHPSSVGESYTEHMGMAGRFGWALLKASGACFVHAVVPGLCVRTGSRIISDLHARMVVSRVEPKPQDEDAMLWLAANI